MPEDACSIDSHCKLPNTVCAQEEGAGLHPFRCKCMQGYQPIPDPLRNIGKNITTLIDWSPWAGKTIELVQT